MRHLTRRFAVASLLVSLILPSLALACLWDYDTLQMERSRFPNTLELVTGKFLRHSPEFYEWRIANRLLRLESDPSNTAILDDLAVAYDKTGQHEKAIETALYTEKLHPGRYETAANLGTFLFHAGKLQEGIPHIERALKINPNAHFGREKYQLLLVQYVLDRRNGGPLILPLADTTQPRGVPVQDPTGAPRKEPLTFAQYLESKTNRKPLSHEETTAAIKGILGMMKFGKHDSPVLLEALGSLLVSGPESSTPDGKLLAGRALLKASYEVPEGQIRNAYRGMAKQALFLQTGSESDSSQVSLDHVEMMFWQELDEAKAWYTELRERELSWIRDGLDPEAEFDALYTTDPQLSTPERTLFTEDTLIVALMSILWGVVLISTIAFVVLVFIILKRKVLGQGNGPNRV